jgi:hypothetical protein
MPKRGAARSGAAPADDPWAGASGLPDDDAPASSEDKHGDPETNQDKPERPARRRRSRVEEGAKSEAGADMDGQLPPDEPAEDKPRRGRRNRAPKEEGTADSTESRPRHATQDVIGDRSFDFSDIDATELEFGSLDDADDFLSLLYYGREGTTKTTCSLRMTRLDKPGKVLLINAEGGAKKQALAKHGVDTARVVTWPAPGKRVTFDGLEALFYRLAADLDRDPTSWLGVVWDSGTEIVQTVLDQVVEAAIAEQEEIIAKTRGRAGNISVRDRFDNDRDDYRKMSNMVRSLVRKYRYLPCHFVMTALTREDEKGKRTVYGPKFTPALADDILGYMDQVLYCKSTRNKGKPIYYATTVQADDDRAKDRYDSLPRELVDPGFDRVMAYISGELVASEDPVQDKMPGGAVQEREPEEAVKPARAGRASGRRAAKAEPESNSDDADEAQASNKPTLTDEATEPETVHEQPKPARRGRRTPPAKTEAAADETEMTEAQRAVIAEQEAKRRVLGEQADKEATPAQRTRGTRSRRTAAKSGKAEEVKYNDEPPF